MADQVRTFALFRVAAGPRIGYGHLRRATVLAGAMNVPCAVSLRGRGVVPATWQVAPTSPAAALAFCRPRLLVIDDPRATLARPWLIAARRAAIPCASLHDVGLASLPSDLAVDGSLRPGRHRSARAVLAGPSFAVLGVSTARAGRPPIRATVRRIVVTLGGGRHLALSRAIVEALTTALPGVQTVVLRGFAAGRRQTMAGMAGVEVVEARDGAAALIATADLAIVGGGLTLYEAVNLGVPAIAVPVVEAQRRTVDAFVREGLAVTIVSDATAAVVGRRVAAVAARLVADVARRRRMRIRGPRRVDGHGTSRVARALLSLVEAPRA